MGGTRLLPRFLLLLSISCSLVVARMSLALAREDEDPTWLVDRIDPKCSRPCGGGQRRVAYKCAVYKHSSGETFSVDPDRCRSVVKPPEMKPCNQEKCFFNVLPVQSMSGSPFQWRSTKQWTKCINGCFGGTRCIVNRCWDTRTATWSADINCAGLEEPRKICETCRESVSCTPQWRKSEWSDCSRTCGSGIRTREVYCANQMGADYFVPVDPSKCKTLERPHSSERCAKVDCPPEFVTSKWGPCKNANSANCGIGERRRNVACLKTLANGVPTKVGFRQCVYRFGAKAFPAKWIKCTDYSVKLSDNCKRSRKGVRATITIANTTIIQMKKAKRIRLQVGETAYVFPSTALVIKCPVKDFDPRDLVWMHNGRQVNVARKRIQMNFRGRLKIRSSRMRDRGTWTCLAGSSNASITLHLRYPSDGFREYAIRQPLLTKLAKDHLNAMMADSPAGVRKSVRYTGRTRRAVQWVTGPWTACSRTCGGRGTMTRRVQCERVRDVYYKVYPDKNCAKTGLQKPASEKQCGSPSACPMWQIDNNRGKCTNQCRRPGFALLKDRIFCGMSKQRLPLHFCDQAKKPIEVAECVNPSCQLMWKASTWSACSRSCGGIGVMSRRMECIWTNTEALAGINCYKYAIKMPITSKTCKTPKCHLDCVNLTPQCREIKPGDCRYVNYKRICCKMCEEYAKVHRQKRLRMKMMKKKI